MLHLLRYCMFMFKINSNQMKPKYIIRDREAGNYIDSLVSLEEAQKALSDYEKEDKRDNIYEENFYEIVKG